jgi:hypothetical protein
MDEFAGTAGGSGSKVASFDQGNRQATAGGVERGTGTGDTAADNDDVEDLLA